MNEVTRILSSIQHCDGQAPAQLLPLVYQELRELAAERCRHEKPGYSLQATALVHEAYLRLVDRDQPQQFNGRGHFFAAAAEAMRRILVERARHRQRIRHGGGRRRLDLKQLDAAQLILANDVDLADDLDGANEVLALDEALARLAVHDPQAAEVVKLRYFAGVTAEQAADALDISLRTANRHWAYAKAWLYQQLSEHRSDAGDQARG
ncbi:MAG: ECF-type sigma factor [Tepidisphaeraceae bacterium]